MTDGQINQPCIDILPTSKECPSRFQRPFDKVLIQVHWRSKLAVERHQPTRQRTLMEGTSPLRAILAATVASPEPTSVSARSWADMRPLG